MPRGQPDGGMYAVKEVAGSVSDVGELAAMLGSIVTYDKRGDVIDFDDFESPVLKWVVSTAGLGGTAQLLSTSVKKGSQSCLLHGLGGADSYIQILKSLGMQGTKRLGYEVSFSIPNTNGVLELRIIYQDGTTEHRAGLQFNPLTTVVSVWDDTPAWVPIAIYGVINTVNMMFYTVKMVVDFATLKYVRVLFNQHQYNVETISVETPGGVGAPRVDYECRIVTPALVESDWSIDNVIWTQAEP